MVEKRCYPPIFVMEIESEIPLQDHLHFTLKHLMLVQAEDLERFPLLISSIEITQLVLHHFTG